MCVFIIHIADLIVGSLAPTAVTKWKHQSRNNIVGGHLSIPKLKSFPIKRNKE